MMIIGSAVDVIKGKYQGNYGIIKNLTTSMVYVKITSISPEVIVRVLQSSVASKFIDNTQQPLSNLNIKIDKFKNAYKPSHFSQEEIHDNFNHCKLGSQNIEVIICKTTADEKKTCFLELWFKDDDVKILKVQSSLPQLSMPYDNEFYNLLTSKSVKDKSFGKFGKNKETLQSVYMVIENSAMGRLVPQIKLDQLADFKSLPDARKTAARLEMLQSLVLKKNVKSNSTHSWMINGNFEMIDEPQPSDDSGGCGFIPDAWLTDLVGGTIIGRRTTSIQVRIFAPSLGIFKGMLTRKLHINKIQLPPSMCKVGPSKMNSKYDNNIWILIKNIHPSTNNLYIGKWINGINPPKSFYQNKLSDMIYRIFRSIDIPVDIIDKYSNGDNIKKEHTNKNNNDITNLRKEAWVVGITDPTDSIPEDYVYITGFTDKKLLKSGLFVTRSPCVTPSDCRFVPVLTDKPEGMTSEQWDFLEKRSMGEIIFYNKKVNNNNDNNNNNNRKITAASSSIGLPMLIGEGDLDGDLYFICWDENIIKYTSTSTIIFENNNNYHYKEKIKKDPIKESDNNDWLVKAQAHMTDPSIINEKKLIGKIYNEMKKIVDCSKYGCHDKDAQLLAYAYKQAIDGQKHGGEFDLPDHLRKLVGLY